MQPTLLIIAGVAFVAAFALRSVKPDKQSLAWSAFGAGIVLAAVAFIVPAVTEGGGISSSDIELSIVAPEEGATVAAGTPITVVVEVSGAELATSPQDQGGHIHVYVDGTLEQMPMGSTTTIALKPGEREITVEYVDAQHAKLDPPVETAVTVTAERARRA
ncbi:MAG: hypothetical protein ACRDKT_13530 [Actinomycetota bacterium]